MDTSVQPNPASDEDAPAVAPIVIAGSDANAALHTGDLKPRDTKDAHVPATPPRRKSRERGLLAAFSPNRSVAAGTMIAIALAEAGLALLIWLNSPFKVLPRPMEVLEALQRLWMTQGLGQDLGRSFTTNLEALAWSSLIALGLAYSTVLPFMRPVVAAIARGRFLSTVGFTLVFTLIFGGGHPLKVAILVFGITVFYVTSMASVIAAIPKGEFDHARTLQMSEWRVVWEVVILGSADKAFEVLRQNAAIGWMMLTLVEGLVRSGGGLGVMLLNLNKQVMLAEVFAVQIVILLVGLGQDFAIGLARRAVCPYADLTLERK
jgi:NitT/TauT family transport system permease protein